MVALEAKTSAETSPLTKKPDEALLKGELLKFYVWETKQGYDDEATKNRITWLKGLARKGADLWDPESVKELLASRKNWRGGYKMLLVYAYESWLRMQGLTWERPHYSQEEFFPFVPMEKELDQLIAAVSKTLGIFLQGLKETGADPGELVKLKWTDLNVETATVNIGPVKDHNPRILKVSQHFIALVQQLKMRNENIFPCIRTLSDRFFRQRKAIAHKLESPRIRKISFTTFRHWKGTMEYHRTKDILYVKKILGHKSITSTLKYIDLEANIFGTSEDQFTVKIAMSAKEASQLIEVGFEYVTGEYDDGGKLFRKRK